MSDNETAITSDRRFYKAVANRAQHLLEDVEWEVRETGEVQEDTLDKIKRHLDMYYF